jgi:hypothetical protein
MSFVCSKIITRDKHCDFQLYIVSIKFNTANFDTSSSGFTERQMNDARVVPEPVYATGLLRRMTLRNNILNKALDHRPCGLFVGGGDVKDTVGVNVEGDLDLRDTAGSRGDAGEFEFAEEVVVLRARTLTLVHLDKHTGLVVGVGGEGLRLLRGDSGVALDESGHDTTNGLDTEGQGSDVEEEVLRYFLASSGSSLKLERRNDRSVGSDIFLLPRLSSAARTSKLVVSPLERTF